VAAESGSAQSLRNWAQRGTRQPGNRRLRHGPSPTSHGGWIRPAGWRAVIQMEVDIQGTEGMFNIVSDQEGLQLARNRLDTPFFLDPWTTEKLPIEAFIASVRDDTSTPVSPEEGLACTAVVEAIVHSLRTGDVVAVQR
jgi:predicted dehydrogenase